MKNICSKFLKGLGLVLLVQSCLVFAQPGPTPTWTDPKAALAEYPDFEFLGEYENGKDAIQVVPCQGRFYVSTYQGGLPGDGWNGGKIQHKWVERKNLKKALKGFRKANREWKEGVSMAPEGAIVLFDGTNVDAIANGKIVDGLLQAGCKTKQSFKDFTLHFEYRLPFKPELPLSHPDRGNSGVFALGCYEVQISDNFGLDIDPSAWVEETLLKKPNTWSGSVYGLRTADVNVCLPPLVWQSYDIEFTAAHFEGDRKMTPALITVHHNGVLIHEDYQIPLGTGGGPSGPRAEVAEGPIMFQNHHNPVVFRNIWVIDKSL